MQEDLQPNERRIQRKGDHRVPKVRSSLNSGRFLHRCQPQHSHPPRFRQSGKSQHKILTPRDHDAGLVVTSDSLPGGKGSNRRRRHSGPRPRGSNPSQDKAATNRRFATDSASKPLLPNDSCPGPSHTTPLASGTLLTQNRTADTQNNPLDPHQLTSRGQGRDVHRHAVGQSPSPSSAGRKPHNSEFPENKLLGTISRTLHEEIKTQSSTKLIKRKIPELRFTPTAFPQAIHRERPLKQGPDDVIDLTLDSSEFFDMPIEEPPSDGPRSVRVDPASPAPPSSEKTSSDDSIPGFSAGSAILDRALNLVKKPHDKPRSFIRYTLDFESCLANISAHGFVDQICTVPRWGREMIRLPENPASEFVDDACVLNPYGSALLVLAHNRENNPVTIHRLGYRSPTRQIGSYDQPVTPGKPKGLTAICSMMQPLSFVTGGADHAIHIWNVDHDLRITCSKLPLAIRHTSRIYSLLPILDSSHKLVSSGADCNVNVYDLASERVVNTIKLSNPGFNVHSSGNPSTILIQTAHREHQFELRDLRERPTSGAQVETFGFTSDSLRLPRFARGDVAHLTLFACGDLEGRVHIWDLRNVKQPATQIKCFQTKINNVTWHESHILASSDDNCIATIPYTYTNSVIQPT